MNDDANTPWLIICVAVAVAMLRISLAAADAIVLSFNYGAAVSRDHLHIVGRKPELVVSNGAILYGWGFRHYLIAGGLWLAASYLLLLLCWRFLLPERFRHESAPGLAHRTTVLGLLWTLSLFFLVGGVLPFAPALAFAGLSLVVAFWWAWRPRPAMGGATR